MKNSSTFFNVFLYVGMLAVAFLCNEVAAVYRYTGLAESENQKMVSQDFAVAFPKTQGRGADLNGLLLDVAETPEMLPDEKYSAIVVLLFAKADAQAQNADGESVLYKLVQCACTNERDDTKSITRVLRDVHVDTEEGATLLEYAGTYNKPYICSLLTAAGARHDQTISDTLPKNFIVPGLFFAGATALWSLFLRYCNQ